MTAETYYYLLIGLPIELLVHRKYVKGDMNKGPSININVHRNPNNVRKGGRGLKPCSDFFLELKH